MGIYIALGANQNAQFEGKSLTPEHTFAKLVEVFEANGIDVLAISGVWQSPAWPDPDTQPAYKNSVIEVKTDLSAKDLITVLKTLEYSFGRLESERNAARPLDLDIVDYEGRIVRSNRLTLPHPRMLERAFVLFPLQEIAPHWRDPKKNREIQDWIARLPLSNVAHLHRLGSFN